MINKAYRELETEFYSRYDARREAFAATAADCRMMALDDMYPSDEEMEADGWSLVDGVWTHPDYPHEPLQEIPDSEIPF